VRGRGYQRLRGVLFLGVGLTMVLVVLAIYWAGVLQALELQTVDQRFTIRGSQGPPKEVVAVLIDDVTFSDLQEQWPFPRSLHGKVIDRIAKDGASAIAFDVQFTEPSRPKEDNALIEAVGAAGNVILATTEVDAQGHSNVFGGDDVVKSVGAYVGNALLPTDEGGVIRRVPYEVDGLKTFAVVAAEVATGTAIRRSDLGARSQWIDFAGPPGTVDSISYSQVLRGKFPRGFFRGKMVVVGPSAPSLQDVHPTSTSGNELMAGAEIQANAVATALDGFPLRSAPLLVTILLIVMMGLVAPIASLRWSPLRVLFLSLGIGAAYGGATQLVFQTGTVLPFIYPLLSLALAAVGSLAVSYLLAAFERERVRDVFSRFVPEQVVDEVLKRTDEDLRLGGVRLVATVLFSDLRGFTSFAESMQADQVIEVLNRYLGEMSDAILDNGGTLVAYMGDGIMAVFGAPIESDDHAERALAAAKDMLEVRLPRFNTWMSELGIGDGFKMGIGLNSGPLMSGNVGSARRLEYTAIGDTTNTASRLEGMTKGTPHSIFVAESTRDLLGPSRDSLEFVDEFEVRGKQAKIRLWTVSGRQEPAPAASEAGLVSAS
jgi:adenylate cyclase